MAFRRSERRGFAVLRPGRSPTAGIERHVTHTLAASAVSLDFSSVDIASCILVAREQLAYYLRSSANFCSAIRSRLVSEHPRSIPKTPRSKTTQAGSGHVQTPGRTAEITPARDALTIVIDKGSLTSCHCRQKDLPDGTCLHHCRKNESSSVAMGHGRTRKRHAILGYQVLTITVTMVMPN